MKKNIHTDPSILSKIKRRSFLQLAGFSALSSFFLVSCGDDDPGPAPSPKPELDKTLAFFGDSLTVGSGGSASYGTAVGKSLDNRPVFIDAIGGQNSAQIAARQGGLPLKISVEGNAFRGAETIPITKISNEFLSTAATVNQLTRKVTVAGVKCTIIRNGKGNPTVETYRIRPDVASTTAVPEDSLVILENAEKAKTATQILWYGRNDVAGATVISDILSNIEHSVAYIAEPKRFIILGVLAGLLETMTTDRYKWISELNSHLEAKYGDMYVPMLPPTTTEMTAVNYTPTDQDKVEIENGVFPMGLRADRTHLNNDGYQIVANRVISKMKELKY
ncbi:SGNH/GDSL hydrolase family protein [Dyadobacter chenhuakuii]|uniref:SGNH/GDSL hydrolase family protein n=1 Tax=Dyadobacter chenhuakuii TaxID=2909339 RepID=A0A9X1TWL6_9BACT|nr:SGNH/GDSL hydrolase family protein [Dyadobacter chenhuakuii]MCF2501518.1 SGNH/GDSL hydrolase family protein [Dyadobacter chenhuakuii]